MKKIIILALIAAPLLGVLSCKKQIDLQPTDVISEDQAYRSIRDLEEGAIGVYSAFGGGYFNGMYIGSILADEAKISNENRGQGQFQFKWQYSSGPGEHNNDFATFYRAIDRINRILARAEELTASGAAEAALKAKVIAEITAMRGMAYYELLIRFAQAGYNPSSPGVAVLTVSSLTGKPPRNTVGDVMARVEADLAAARASADLPNNVADGLRLSKAAVAGYQARAALYRRDWNAAATFATDAINLSGTTVISRANYSTLWTDVANTEVVFRFRNNYSPQTLWRDVNGDVFFEPSDKLKQSYNRTTDIRFPTFFGSAGSDTSIVIKYPGSALQGPQRNDLKAIRLSEMHLIRAEARAELNQLALAADDVNALRSNRISGYTNVVYADKATAIGDILVERMRELCFEGFRFFDLKRRELPVNRLTSDVQSTVWQNLPVGDYHFALPLPQQEVFVNPNVTQNPGY